MLKIIKSNSEFKNLIETGPALIDFFTKWCGPCKIQTKILKSNESHLKNLYEGLKIYKLDCEDLNNIAEDYDIRSIPRLILFKEGNVYKMDAGLQRLSEIKAFLNDHLTPTKEENMRDKHRLLSEEIGNAYHYALKVEKRLFEYKEGLDVYLKDKVIGKENTRIINNLLKQMDNVISHFNHSIIHSLDWWNLDLIYY
ncbi:MAG: thioredoxin domain-containing protein [Promethearchaeia archaeon]